MMGTGPPFRLLFAKESRYNGGTSLGVNPGSKLVLSSG